MILHLYQRLLISWLPIGLPDACKRRLATARPASGTPPIEHETAAGLTFFAEAEGLIEGDASLVFAKDGMKARF